MSQESAAIVLAILGSVLVIAGLFFFRRPRWLLGWLKGMAVFGIILIGLYALATAVNVAGYEPLRGMKTVATVTSRRQAEQVWSVILEPASGRPRTETLRGDQWQLEARVIRFTGPLRWLGVAPGYRLEKLSGRYTSLEQERTAPPSVVPLAEPAWPDLWEIDRHFDLPFVEGVRGNATFMPMRDGATFEVRLSGAGLVAVPRNDEARKAVQVWDE